MNFELRALLGSALVAALATPAVAQTAAPAPVVAAPVVVGATDTNVLRTGTPVPLKMSEELTTNGKKLLVGYRFRMEVAEPVMVGGNVVIPVGSPATGEVTQVRNKGMWGKSGAINARVLYAQVNGRQIRLSGQIDDKGITGTGAVVGALLVLPVAGFFTTGTSAVIPMGAPVKAFVDEDVPVALAAGAVPAPAAIPALPAAAPSTASSSN